MYFERLKVITLYRQANWAWDMKWPFPGYITGWWHCVTSHTYLNLSVELSLHAQACTLTHSHFLFLPFSFTHSLCVYVYMWGGGGLCVCLCIGACVWAHLWRPEANVGHLNDCLIFWLTQPEASQSFLLGWIAREPQEFFWIYTETVGAYLTLHTKEWIQVFMLV